MAVRNTGSGQEKNCINPLNSPNMAGATIPFENNDSFGHAAVCAACPLRVRQAMSRIIITEDV